MRHIKQRNAINCGLAVVATLADCSYEQARQADPFPEKTIGLSCGDFLTAIHRVSNGKYSVTRPKALYRLREFPDLDQCAVIIRQPRRKYGHWIAIDGRTVFDPELSGPVRITQYDRNNWDVIRIVRRSDETP